MEIKYGFRGIRLACKVLLECIAESFSKIESEESVRDTDRLIDDAETSGCGISWLCDPDALCHRLIALALMSLLGFGAYFCMDNPGALQVMIYTAFHYSRMLYVLRFFP